MTIIIIPTPNTPYTRLSTQVEELEDRGRECYLAGYIEGLCVCDVRREGISFGREDVGEEGKGNGGVDVPSEVYGGV